jgi:hypothetical protein
MQQADFNHNDFSNQQEADKALMVRFFYKDRPDKAKTMEEGRPIFKEVTYVEIRVAGQRDVQACRPASLADKQRFPLHFEAFEKRVEPPSEGMPLSEWSQITRSEAEELTFMSVKTVEQLASMKDSNLGNFRGGYALRDKAVKWLKNSAIEVEASDKAEMAETIATLQAQVQQLLAAQVAITDTVAAPSNTRVNVLLPVEELTSELDAEPVEGAAIAVPAAPAAIKAPSKRKSRRK